MVFFEFLHYAVLAQEVQKVLPEAVQQIVKDVQLTEGSTVSNLLVVNERVLLFENIGATQELAKLVTEEGQIIDAIDGRVGKLEQCTTPL